VNFNYSIRIFSATSSSLADTFPSDPSILRSRDDTEPIGLNAEVEWEGEGDIEMQGEQVMLLPIAHCVVCWLLTFAALRCDVLSRRGWHIT
jgi:hypothetical protein